MTKTTIGQNINKPFVGYMINVELNEDGKKQIAKLQQQLTKKFGKALWHQPPESMHITLFDWIAPLVDYGTDKDKLFKKIFTEYDSAVEKILKNNKPINLHFQEVKAAPAAIFMIGSDNGEFKKIRDLFLESIELLPNTKQPPQIIHSTISRFVSEIELEPIERFLEYVDISINQTISSFRLVREEVDPMLKFSLVKEYPIG